MVVKAVQGEPAGVGPVGGLEGEGKVTSEEDIVAVNLRQLLGKRAASHASRSV